MNTFFIQSKVFSSGTYFRWDSSKALGIMIAPFKNYLKLICFASNVTKGSQNNKNLYYNVYTNSIFDSYYCKKVNRKMYNSQKNDWK